MSPRFFFALILASLSALGLSTAAVARPPQLDIPAFTHLNDTARESVNITVGALPLSLARWAFAKNPQATDELKDVLKGVKSVSICHYEFDSEHMYSQDDIESVRTQLSNPAWSQLAQVRDRRAAESVDVYVSMEQDRITGLAIVASQPREFTIVNIIGSIDLEQVDRLRAQFDPENDFRAGLVHSPSGS